MLNQFSLVATREVYLIDKQDQRDDYQVKENVGEILLFGSTDDPFLPWTEQQEVNFSSEVTVCSEILKLFLFNCNGRLYF